jgi:hypothetical protein
LIGGSTKAGAKGKVTITIHGTPYMTFPRRDESIASKAGSTDEVIIF